MRWVVLLRAVNLGSRNKVPMAELRVLLEEAGYENVRTYIASGNIVLDGPRGAADLAATFERLIADSFGVKTTAIVRTPRALATTVAKHPFDDSSETHVGFLAARPGAAGVRQLEAVDPGSAVVTGTDLYLRLPTGVHGSRLSIARVESLLGVQATLRNWRTVVALAELAADA
jgi:uncharacterized protein (DUF1697 family)